MAAFLLVPPTLKASVGPPAGFTLQELADLVTPVVIVPILWWVLAGTTELRGRTLAVALVLSIAWIDAHGIHLAANAIGDVFPAGPARDVFYATPAGDLDHFLDERVGHWEWHAGWAGWSALLLTTSIRAPAAASANRWLTPAVAGAIHGLTFFFVTTEGGTVPLGAAVSVVLAAAGGLALRRGSRHPVTRFLVVGSVVTIALYAAWALVNGGRLVEPCAALRC